MSGGGKVFDADSVFGGDDDDASSDAFDASKLSWDKKQDAAHTDPVGAAAVEPPPLRAFLESEHRMSDPTGSLRTPRARALMPASSSSPTLATANRRRGRFITLRPCR